MKPKNNNRRPLEFYEHETNIDPNFCDHSFTRLSSTRVVCKRCGLGFFDNPADPFPVEEMNKAIQKEKRDRKPKKNNTIENNK